MTERLFDWAYSGYLPNVLSELEGLALNECAVSGGVGSHVILQLNDGVTIEVRPAWTELVKTYELSPSFSACGKAADHTFPRRQPGSDRRRDNDP